MRLANPSRNLVTSTTRSWRDANRNFVPDCNLLNALANGECGPLANRDFGGVRSRVTYDSERLNGWDKRNYNWEFSAGVQQELIPRVSADVSYIRRSYGNFPVTANLATNPADFDPFSITAPSDPRLPGEGGYVISGLYTIKPEKFGVPAENFVTLSRKSGNQLDYWQGVTMSVNARPQPGTLLQAGVSTGRRVTDDCEIRPHLDNPSLLYCHVAEAFRTQVKGLASYTIPRWDVQVSGTFQSVAGPQILANYTASNAEVVPSLGRNLAGGARNITVNIVAPGTMYGDRLNQLDLRASKLLRFGRFRTRVNADVYNVLNSSAVLSLNNRFAAWQQPTLILVARFVKFSAQVDF
jgi:hypothetical protein